MPTVDLNTITLLPLAEVSKDDAVKYGAKTANLSEPTLAEERAKTLSMLANRASKVFKNTEVLDIEWVLETKDGKDKFWLVQARPYVVNKMKEH